LRNFIQTLNQTSAIGTISGIETMVVSRTGLAKKDLQQFLDDIVFISKTEDTRSKQSEIVSALHRQINQEKQASQKKPKKKNFPIANQRQLSLYEKGVKSLRKRNSRVDESLKSGHENRPAVRDGSRRKLDQKNLGRTKPSRRMKREPNLKTLERDDAGNFKGRGRNPFPKHANSTLSRLHRGLPELFDGLRMDVESLPFSKKHDARISTKKLSPITMNEKKRDFFKERAIHTSTGTQVTSASSSVTSISDSDASMSSLQCDSTLEKKKYEAVSIEQLRSKNIPNQEQVKDFIEVKILNYANRSLGVEKHEHKAHHIQNFHDRYWEMNINFESDTENVEMILNPPVP
jgi:hypothetical protein